MNRRITERDASTIPEFEHLRDYIIVEKGGRRAAGGAQVTMRCPYCGDSRDPKSQHFYIGPDRKKNLVLSYHCFLCNVGGIITGKFFRDIECYDTDLINEILDYNVSKYRNTYYARRNVEHFNRYANTRIINVMDSKEAFDKLNYINNRLGVNLSFEDLVNLKIVLNLNRYLNDNRISFTTRYPDIMNELSKKFIGFLSVDNSYVIMRTIVDPKTLSKTISHRYTNYAIFNIPDMALYYVIPGQIDPYKHVNVYITEGPFDILGVYFNVVQDKTNSIFAASAGKSNFMSLIDYMFNRIGIPCCRCHIHLYSDSDLKMEEITKIKNNMNSIGVPFTVHINGMEGEKDFGVTKDRIIDRVLTF